MFVMHRQKQVRVKKTDSLCDKTATSTAVIIALKEGSIADQDPSGFTPCLAGNGTDAFVYPEVLLLWACCWVPLPITALWVNLVFERKRSRWGWLESCAVLDGIPPTPYMPSARALQSCLPAAPKWPDASDHTINPDLLCILLCSCLDCFQ